MFFMQCPVQDILPKGAAQYYNQQQQNGLEEIHNEKYKLINRCKALFSGGAEKGFEIVS